MSKKNDGSENLTKDEDDVFVALETACASLTATALSCPTLLGEPLETVMTRGVDKYLQDKRPAEFGCVEMDLNRKPLPNDTDNKKQHLAATENDDESYSSQELDILLRQEMKISEWLDRQISVHPTDQQAVSSSIDVTHFEVVDDTARIGLENLYLSRVHKFQQAQMALKLGESGTDQHEDDELAGVVRRACQSRTTMDVQTLKVYKEYQRVRQELQQERQQCQEIQKEIQLLWDKKQEVIKESIRRHDKDGIVGRKGKHRQRLTRENKVLQQLTVDLLTAGGLDWYNDERLGEILLRYSKDRE